ncbi:hypothetical protein KP79_PYT24349 [Mizuhopecten yessoensis]|uniref:Retrotransposon gag domain-containing protein n=1 Tax=Mizuhopecten yessoensis TaxID=6573 RepID=A0A210QS51_MIZYE|nr:hypothetical protein KP79_PYT24349 [Mizuhopecten yessoensis]
MVGPSDYTAVFYCLVDDAFEYTDKLPRTLGFTKLKKKMMERSRRELHFTKQEETENLAEFAHRIQTIIGDGFAHSDTTTRNQIAPDAFRKGCCEKMAAQRAIKRNPNTVHKALKGLRGQSACSVWFSRTTLP